MPVIKSSQKRARQAVKRTARNVHFKKKIRLAFQAFTTSLDGGKKTDIANAQTKMYSLLDTATKKNIFHKNKTARRKAKIAQMAKQAGTSKVAPKPTTKTPAKQKATKWLWA